jgi:hypothetical protein
MGEGRFLRFTEKYKVTLLDTCRETRSNPVEATVAIADNLDTGPGYNDVQQAVIGAYAQIYLSKEELS